MDLLNLTKRGQIHEFYKKGKIEKIFIFQITVLNLVIYTGGATGQKMQNFSSISPKLQYLGQKNPQKHRVLILL